MASNYPDKLSLLFYIQSWFHQSLDSAFGRPVLDSNFVITVLQRPEKGFQRLEEMAAGLESMASDLWRSSGKISLVWKYSRAGLGFRGASAGFVFN